MAEEGEDQPGERELLLPMLTLEDVQQKIEPFLSKHPEAKVVTVDLDEKTRFHRIENPWNDPTLSIILPDDLEHLAEALNQLYLPERLSALWHLDSRDLEVIWTALPLSEDQKAVQDRKFTFKYAGKKYKCEFGNSSDRLELISKFSIPITNPSSTNFRNLQSFIRSARKDLFNDKADYHCRSFWIRNVRLGEKPLIKMLECLNFYMSYYDAKSPTIMIHDLHSPVNSKTRYIEGSFPANITGRTLDENLVSFWDSARHQNAMLKFIFYYRIIEYTASHFVDATVRAKLAKMLRSPTLGRDMDRSIDAVLSAFDGSQAQEVPRFNNLIVGSVDPDVVWREIENNKAMFVETVKFDGGYALQAIISKDETLATFSSGGLVKFAHAIRNIRNVLVHGRDQNTATAITPTPRNMKYLSAWVNATAAAAGEVVLYGSNS